MSTVAQGGDVKVTQRHWNRFQGGNRIYIVDLTHTDEIFIVMHGRSQLDGSKGKLRVSEIVRAAYRISQTNMSFFQCWQGSRLFRPD